MANYVCTCRSNYFRVKDVKKFQEWVGKYAVEMRINVENLALVPDETLALFGTDPDGAGWPCFNPETGEQIDFFTEVSEHLKDGEVAIFMEAGHEKLRYVTGIAVAVNHKGDCTSVTLDDIYDRVRDEWGVLPTKAAY